MSSNNLADLQGRIGGIIFTSQATGYTVAKIKVSGRKDLATITGSIINPTRGEIIKIKGEWTNNPKYGEQFKIVFCQPPTPSSEKPALHRNDQREEACRVFPDAHHG
jgi:exodeoxyribonuclease V alpha subunit